MTEALHTVHVRVNDAATGQPTPVRIQFTDENGTYYAPFGRLIPCETVITVDSASIQTPIIGLVTEDIYHGGKLVIPAGTEVHGTAQSDRHRERIASGSSWTLVWQTGEELRLKAIALDREFSAFLLKLLADPPRFPPEPVFVAPRFAREAPTVFHALRWGQVLEQQVSDVLAAPDATPQLTAERLDRVVNLYRLERWALTEPAAEAPPSEALALAPRSARILLSGTRLFARAYFEPTVTRREAPALRDRDRFDAL